MSGMSPLELAVKNEQAEIDFYKNEAERSTNRAARSLVAMLADPERHHITLLEDLSERLAKSGGWPARIDPAATGEDVIEVLDRVAALNADAPPHDGDDLAALKTAIDFEERAEAFYTKLADESGGGPERAFFQALAGFERDHRAWIEAFRATIGDAGAP
jgi:rubrerythrin